MADFRRLQQTDFLGILSNRQGPHYSHENYVKLFQLAGLNKEWRNVVQDSVVTSLKADAEEFMSNVGLLYQRGDFAVIVRGLLHFEYTKQAFLQLYGITAIHVACTTGRHLHDTRVLKESALAGGARAVVGAMIMNQSSLPLHIVCTRMLALYARYRPPISTWSGWTTDNNATFVREVLEAMQRFPLAIDMQRCGAKCLLAMCKSVLIVDTEFDAIAGTTCTSHFLSMRGPRVVLAAMRAHNDAELHVTVCKLLGEFSKLTLPSQILMGEATDNIHFLTAALQYNVVGMHLRAARHLCNLLANLCLQSSFTNHLVHMVEIPTLLVGVMRQAVANIHTETSLAAIKNFKAVWCATAVLFRLLLITPEEAQFVWRLVAVPESITTILQVLAYIHDISTAPPSALFEQSKHIELKMCLVLEERLLLCLEDIKPVDTFSENVVQAGGLLMVLNIIVETQNGAVRRSACAVVDDLVADDNMTRRWFSGAGGVQKFAVLLREAPVSERYFLTQTYRMLLHLAQFPNYKKEMVDAGFLEITRTHLQASGAIPEYPRFCLRLHNRLQEVNGT